MSVAAQIAERMKAAATKKSNPEKSIPIETFILQVSAHLGGGRMKGTRKDGSECIVSLADPYEGQNVSRRQSIDSFAMPKENNHIEIGGSVLVENAKLIDGEYKASWVKYSQVRADSGLSLEAFTRVLPPRARGSNSTKTSPKCEIEVLQGTVERMVNKQQLDDRIHELVCQDTSSAFVRVAVDGMVKDFGIVTYGDDEQSRMVGLSKSKTVAALNELLGPSNEEFGAGVVIELMPAKRYNFGTDAFEAFSKQPKKATLKPMSATYLQEGESREGTYTKSLGFTKSIVSIGKTGANDVEFVRMVMPITRYPKMFKSGPPSSALSAADLSALSSRDNDLDDIGLNDDFDDDVDFAMHDEPDGERMIAQREHFVASLNSEEKMTYSRTDLEQRSGRMHRNAEPEPAASPRPSR